MADILNFPSKSDEKPGHSFLQGRDNTVSFDADGHLTLLNGALENAYAEVKDWTNQELASLYRVKGLLNATGYFCEVDRGVTDEGDPWCVFCNSTSDVFIHLCRIDGEYLLDSPNLSTPLRGSDFTGLVNSFVDHKLPRKDQAEHSGPRVVKFTQGSQLYLHPSAMLAALIWTLLLASEELVMVLPEQSETDADLSNVSAAGATLDTDSTFEALIEDVHYTGQFNKDALPHELFEIYHSRLESAQHEQKLGQGGYFVGLNAIAISLGLLAKELLFWGDERAHKSETDFLLISEKRLDESADEEQSIFADIEFNSDLLLGVEQVLEFLETALVDVEDEDEDGNVIYLEGHAEPILTQVLNELAPAHTEAALTDATYSDDVLPISGLEDLTLISNLEAIEQSGTEANGSFEGLLLAAETNLGEFRDFQIGGVSIQATFDITENDFAVAYSIVNETSIQHSVISVGVSVELPDSAKPPTYDQAAQEFINHLIGRDDNFEMISTQNELILLDLDVLTAAAEESYLFTWTLDNGTSVSAIGLRADFEQFELIA